MIEKGTSTSGQHRVSSPWGIGGGERGKTALSRFLRGGLHGEEGNVKVGRVWGRCSSPSPECELRGTHSRSNGPSCPRRRTLEIVQR